MLNNLDFYKSAYKKHGQTARGLNWNSKKRQYIRFEIITSFLKDELSTSSIVDAGCGFGDLYLFWIEKALHVKSYMGIDSVENSIQICHKRFPKISFTCRDILRDDLPFCDWYVASGSLNILSKFDTWLFLENMLVHSKKGIIFNILEGDKHSENFNYQKKEDIIKFLKEKNLKVKIIGDYLESDITVEARK